MTIRARLTLTGAVLLVGTATSACGGGGGAPSDASKDSFCEAANSLMSDLVPADTTTPDLPSEEEMAQAVKDWGARMAEVGTPESISEEARKGFESVVEQAEEIDAEDFSIDDLEQLESGGADASAEVKEQAEAFGNYLTDTCGNPLEEIELPELPDLPGTAQ